MVSQGRALAVAAAWIVLPLGASALAVSVWAAGFDGEWAALGIWLPVAAAVTVAPLSLLAGAIWVARRAGQARSVAALGAQAGLIGLVVAGLAVPVHLATMWS